MTDFICPFCNHKMTGHSAIFGKVCVNCFKVVETSKDLRQSLEKSHKDRQESVRLFLRDKVIRKDYAN